MAKEIPFDPFPLLQGPHHQAIANSFFNFFFDPSSDQTQVLLPDGDRISLEVTTPREWKPTDLTVFLVHGLCGSHKSANLVRMARRLEPLGIRTVRFNMRGCGSGRGLAKHIYHSGRSEYVFESIKAIKKQTPESPIVLIGFSKCRDNLSGIRFKIAIFAYHKINPAFYEPSDAGTTPQGHLPMEYTLACRCIFYPDVRRNAKMWH